MKRFHQLFGISVVVVFLLTGQYMDKYLGHLAGMPDGPRMLYRSRHIYILLAGLLNIGIGTYLAYHFERWRRVLQLLGSGLIVIATCLFIAAFFHEPKLSGLLTPLSQRGIYLISFGTLLHFFSGLRRRQRATDPGL
ncbi:MAG: hypothetical protein ND895_09710 [Pyrinomonadaceae bacterium]|nr:hypothetical protein [Pyrinomonadaceae bacterium]